MRVPQHDWSRRTLLAAAGAVAASPLLVSSVAAAEPTDDAAAVAAALESLRVAILAGDGKALERLLHDKVIYGHSDGHLVQTKAEFIASLAGKVSYRSLVYSDQTYAIVGDTAIVRHTWDGADIMPDGSTGRSYIKVMQVWKKVRGKWYLLGRQSCPIKS